jgi:hypothetical protein
MFHALTLAAALDGIFTLTDRTDTRLRDPDPITGRAALDVDSFLDARAVVRARKDLYTLAYLPQLSFIDVNNPEARVTTFLNAGLASAEWNWPRTLLSLTERASYGTQSFVSLQGATAPGTTPATPPGQPPTVPTVQPVPYAATFPYESSITTLASSLHLRPWTLRASIGYQLAGSTNHASETTTPPATGTTPAETAQVQLESLPLQKGPIGEVSADYAATPHDDLVTDLKAIETSFSTGPEVLLADLEEQWAHKWSRATDTLLAAGGAAARARSTFTSPYTADADPVAEATLNEKLGHGKNQFKVQLDTRLAPLINPFIGSVDEYIRGTILAAWSHRHLLVQAFAAAGETVDQGTPTSSRMIQGEVDVSYQVTEALSFDGGARLIKQSQSVPTPNEMMGAAPTLTAIPFTQGVVFVAITVRPVKLKF